MFKQILVPVDGSPLSQDAARRAVSFAKEAGAKITAFNDMPDYPMSYYSEAVAFNPAQDSARPEKFEELTEQESKDILGFVENLCREAGVDCATETTRSSSVYRAIIEAATKCNCDLIFMASHGRRGLGALLLGSETNKVLTHSKIPVLVYR